MAAASIVPAHEQLAIHLRLSLSHSPFLFAGCVLEQPGVYRIGHTIWHDKPYILPIWIM